jgi:hypothetical protein
MADSKISSLSTDSTPDRTADYLPTYDASAVGNKKITIENAGGYVLYGYFGNALDPADATTYYFSPYPAYSSLATTAANHKIRIPRAGVIRRVYIEGVVVTTLGTSETSTISIRLNDTTDTTIVSTLALNASPLSYSNTSMSITVAQGDWITVKWATPTWVTNPVDVYMVATIWIA